MAAADGSSSRSPWHCALCNLVCTSQTMLAEHERGKKHAKAVARVKPENVQSVLGISGGDRHTELGANVGAYAERRSEDCKEEDAIRGPARQLACIEVIMVQTAVKERPAGASSNAGSPMWGNMHQAEPLKADNSAGLLTPANVGKYLPPSMRVTTPTTIIMDALNWLDKFWLFSSARRNPWRELSAMEQRVRRFARAAQLSGLALVAVIDAATKTAEAQAKWRGRRNREVCREDKHMVLGIDGFFAEILEAAGVRVVRPLDADADDVIAALAADGGPGSCVLSKDSDFFRYVPRVRVCNGWEVASGRLRLAFAPPGSVSKACARNIDFALAKWVTDAGADGGCKLNPSLRGGAITRGTSSSSDKRMGNLHGIARPLRSAVYARLGERSALEKWPEWDEKLGAVLWEERELVADASLDGLLDDPGKVVAWIEERDCADVEERWRQVERAFNRCAVAAELCAAASGGVKRPLEI